MGLFDYLILGAVALCAAFCIFFILRQRKKGCDCTDCSKCRKSCTQKKDK